jgi:hypothetical protein
VTIFGVTDDSREVRFGSVLRAHAAARGAQVMIVLDVTPDATLAIPLPDLERDLGASIAHRILLHRCELPR